MKTVKNFAADESGMKTLEYALLAGLIAIVVFISYILKFNQHL